MKGISLVLASLGLLAVGLASNLRADQWDKRTTLKVSETIQVPGKVLEPGTYVMKLLNSSSNRNIVQIFNSDESELQTTILAIPNYRVTAKEETVFTFWEMPPGEPRALRAWFYPGDNFGQEFAYPKVKALEIAKIEHTEVPATEATKPSELATAPVEEVTETGQELPIPPAPAVHAPAPVEVTQAPVAAPAELPKTGSAFPLVGLGGAISLMIFGFLRMLRTS